MIRSSSACAKALFTLPLLMAFAGCAEPSGAAESVDEPSSKVTEPATPDASAQAPAAPAEDAEVLAATDPAASDEAPGESATDDAPGVEPGTAEAEDEVAAVDPPDEEANLEPRRVLIVGSSLAATGLGAVLEDLLDANPQIIAYRKGKSASGLSRPDFYDWFDQGKRQVEFRKPDLVIVLIGANDGQDLPPWKGEGRIRWDADEWPDAYRGRVDQFLESVTMPVEGSEGARVMWLGLPQVKSPSLERKLTLIRGIHEERVNELGDDGIYLDTTQYLVDEAGKLLATAEVSGKQRELRGEDGVHFTMSGCEYLAAKIYPEVLGALGLPAEASAPEPE